MHTEQKRKQLFSPQSGVGMLGLVFFALSLPFNIPFFNIGGLFSQSPQVKPGQISPTITCIPRPPCLERPPFCYQTAIPETGWCPPTITPPVKGCHYEKPAACPHLCITGRPCPIPCKPILVCPSGTPTPPIPSRPLQLSCSDCLNGNTNQLCFDSNQKISYCSSSSLGILQSSSTQCVSCSSLPQPSLTPPVTITPGTCAPQGTCRNGEQCPTGTICSGVPVYGCYPPGCPFPICLASNTKIATPHGDVAVSNLTIDMLVWTIDHGSKVAAPIIKIAQTPVSATHQVVHVILEDKRELYASPGHPTADGRTIEELHNGDRLDGSRVTKTETISYWDNKTYDLLPQGGTGYYYANGILMGSTLH